MGNNDYIDEWTGKGVFISSDYSEPMENWPVFTWEKDRLFKSSLSPVSFTVRLHWLGVF